MNTSFDLYQAKRQNRRLSSSLSPSSSWSWSFSRLALALATLLAPGSSRRGEPLRRTAGEKSPFLSMSFPAHVRFLLNVYLTIYPTIGSFLPTFGDLLIHVSFCSDTLWSSFRSASAVSGPWRHSGGVPQTIRSRTTDAQSMGAKCHVSWAKK